MFFYFTVNYFNMTICVYKVPYMKIVMNMKIIILLKKISDLEMISCMMSGSTMKKQVQLKF